MDDEAARKRVFVRNDRGQIRCPSFIVIANGGTCATAEPLAPVLTRGKAKEGREERPERGREEGRGRKKGSMHPVDTRLSGEFELKKDVEPGGDSYLAHILKLETFTNHRPARVGNGGV